MNYLKRDKEYTPLAFNHSIENIYAYDRQDSMHNYYSYVVNQIDIDQLLDPNMFYYRRNSRVDPIKMGRGLIFNAYNDGICGVVCFKTGVNLNLEDDFKKELVFILDKYYLQIVYPQILKRIKTAMNTNGFSSRKQILFMDKDEMENRFFCDPLNPTLDSYNANKQIALSSEFLSTLTI